MYNVYLGIVLIGNNVCQEEIRIVMYAKKLRSKGLMALHRVYAMVISSLSVI